MAIKLLEAREGFSPQTGYDEAIFFDERKKCYRLSKVNSNLEYYRYGKLVEKVYFAWSNWKCQAISEILSFNPIVGYERDRWERALDTEHDYGSFKFQLSNDGGTNYYYWNGAAWTLVTDPDVEAQWNTAEDIDENIGTFPLIYDPTDETVQIRPRVLVYSGGRLKDGGGHNRTITPYLKDIDFVELSCTTVKSISIVINPKE